MSIMVDIHKELDSFSLHVTFEAENSVVALLGASGCGKSMTLQCIAGIVKPDSGRIVVDGVTLFDSAKKINLPPQKRHVGLLFQNYALFPNMTVEQNIAAGLRHQKNKKDKLQELIRIFYLTGLSNHYPAQLSGGQQQRAALARMLASEPKLIMLDEPFSAMDNYLRWQLEQELIVTLDRFDGTTLYVSHNRDEVYRICDEICVMNQGRSEAVTTVKRFFDSPGTLPAALLSGCKNYSRAEKSGEQSVFAVDWNCELNCSRMVPIDISHVGVRAHAIFLEPTNPIMRCRIMGITHNIFSTSVTLEPLGRKGSADFPYLYMDLQKHNTADLHVGGVVGVGFAPDDILPLTQPS